MFKVKKWIAFFAFVLAFQTLFAWGILQVNSSGIKEQVVLLLKKQPSGADKKYTIPDFPYTLSDFKKLSKLENSLKISMVRTDENHDEIDALAVKMEESSNTLIKALEVVISVKMLIFQSLKWVIFIFIVCLLFLLGSRYVKEEKAAKSLRNLSETPFSIFVMAIFLKQALTYLLH